MSYVGQIIHVVMVRNEPCSAGIVVSRLDGDLDPVRAAVFGEDHDFRADLDYSEITPYGGTWHDPEECPKRGTR